MKPWTPVFLLVTVALSGPTESWARKPDSAASQAAGAQATVGSVNPGLGPAPARVRRDTPRGTVQGFIDACREGHYARAAHFLDLSDHPEGEQTEQGVTLARRLKFVLDQKLWVDLESVSDDPLGDAEDELGPGKDQIGAIPVAAGEQSIRLRRVAPPGGEPVWLFAPATVAAIDPLYEAFGIGWLGDELPPWAFRFRIWELELWQLAGVLLLLPIAYLLARIAARLITAVVRSAAKRTQVAWDDELVSILERPLRLLLWAALFGLTAAGLRLSQPAQDLLKVMVQTGMLSAAGLFGHRAVAVAARALQRELTSRQPDERRRKGVTTQVTVIQRIASGAVVLVVVALVLAQFQVVRTVGLSLLASAGLAGVVLGFAAQRSVANLFAGVQIMLTQPIRIGDIVIVEGEWGTIEEINFTHVVVKIWDLRRLVVPIAYFLERPFQNWTRSSSELLGTIYFYTDHTIDVGAMRAELDRILAGTDLWDGKVKGVVVTGLKDHVAEVRALISAVDSGKQWELRCLVREKLLDWLQREGKSLPTFRLESGGGALRSSASQEA